MIITTIVGATIALLLAFWATQRSTTEGFRSLLQGMREIERGELGGRIVIETDDELGRLGEGFNDLSRRLELSRAETDSKEAERAKAARQFHEAQKRDALGRLAAGIAHDFNNILAIIVMYSDTVQTRLPEEDDPNRKRLGEVLKAADRGKDLISQILDFTRDKPLEHQTFDLAENVRETIGLIEDTVAKEVDISVVVPEDGLTIVGDATGLHQVLANLAINAVHAMDGGKGRLEIELDVIQLSVKKLASLILKFAGAEGDAVYELEPDGTAKAYLGKPTLTPYARIRVTDNGTGMSLETLRRVFDPYFTTKSVGEGTGLGLAAVAGIAIAHDGGVAVETVEGKGTSFYFCIPLPDMNEGDDNG